MSAYDKIRRTGLGAAGIPCMGKKIIFVDGEYPENTIEALLLENKALRDRNEFLEDTMLRACYEDEECVDFDMENYVYC
jgi:hypothetical protein